MNQLGWLVQDFRYALRGFRKERTFALLAIFALALGIGATTVIYSVIDSVLLHPFPYASADRLVNLYVRDVDRPPEDYGQTDNRTAEFLELLKQMNLFEGVMGDAGADVFYTVGGRTRLANGHYETPNTFEFLGVKPLLGRPITSDDARPGAPPVFAMSARMWRKEFNSDPKILGATFTLNGERRTLVAVMPPRFLLGDADMWLPYNVRAGDATTQQMWWWTLGRMKPGVTLAQVAAQWEIVARRLATVYPHDYPKQFTTSAHTLLDEVIRQFRSVIYMLAAAVAMLLLIACSNVANLLLARATARQKEIAIRASVGASRGRIVRQLLVESFALALAACAIGCLFAYVGLGLVIKVIPPDTIPAETAVVMSGGALGFALLVAAATTLLCGLAPALYAVRGDLQSRLKDSSRGAATELRRGKLRSALVVGEVALSIILLVGAGLMLRTLLAIEHVNLGMNPRNVLVVSTPLPEARYKTPQQRSVFFQELRRRVSTLPGVVSVTQSLGRPPFGGPRSDVTIPGRPHSAPWRTMVELCSEGYFRTLQIPLLRGRLLSESDVATGRRVAVINQSLARDYFGKQDPVGHSIKFNALDEQPDLPHNAYFEIIGVVGDAKNRGLQDSTMPQAFVPYTAINSLSGEILVRTAVDPLSILPSVENQIWSVDPNVATSDTGSLESILQRNTYSKPEFGMILLSIFAGLGLVLVAVGVFSVMSYSVSLRTHEIGIRMALGAERGAILRMVLFHGLGLIAVGVAAGEAGSAFLTRFISGQLWGVSARDPITFALVVAVLLAVGVAACLVPAKRATGVDPLIALRYE
ncbi:MAG TPA: ABC transporter permease [Terriglobales bacterium]|jgi:putative ABC transport system permease protein|nr:ABC transporter permease [Terriglobales bacterium]